MTEPAEPTAVTIAPGVERGSRLEWSAGIAIAPDGTSIRYRHAGSGPPVLVCCGGPNTTHEYLVDDLAPLTDQFTLVFHDYRGSGRSDRADPATYTFEHLAADLDAIRAALGFSQISLVAHSLGGFVALQFALQYGDNCRALALISASPSGTSRRMAIPTLRALGPHRTAKLLWRGVVFLACWSWRTPSEKRTLKRFSIMATMQEGGGRFRDAVRARERFADNHNATHLERHAAQFDVVERLGEVRSPVLVVHGSLDAPFSAALPLFVAGLRDVEVLTLAGVGHHPLVERHKTVLGRLRTFLQAHA